MGRLRSSVRQAAWLAGLACILGIAAPAAAQTTTDDFTTGAESVAWATWQPAMQAILDRNAEKTEQLFGEFLATKPSAFRVALLADRTTNRTSFGGALLLLQQDAENKALGPNAQQVADLLAQGTEQMHEADDAWYFCEIGRFDVADANFRALLGSNPDPVALLEFTDRIKKRREILIQLLDNPIVGQSVRSTLKLLDLGEEKIKADPTRIKTSIERLGGPPRAFENAVSLLKQSGEYAVPFIVDALRNPGRKILTQPILRCLPEISRPAVNPLVIAIRMDTPAVQIYLVEALGKIGYPQALPYLLQLREQAGAPPELTAAIDQAVASVRSHSRDAGAGLTASEAFYRLAQGYYGDQESLAADTRLDTANVWYWRDDLLQNVEVPTQIFNEIMCMRCCEEALRLNADLKPALALWVAADFRREIQLRPDEVDRTRPENYPTAAYFAQTAGPEVCLMVLSRALDDGDPAVALGAIEALRGTAGPATLVADQQGHLPLAEALSFPDRMVRIRAGLTLGAARPTAPFQNYQNLMPVLSEALMLFGGARFALVVDPDAQTANEISGLLRGEGYEVATDAEFLRGLQKVRDGFSSLDVIFVASNVKDVPLAGALQQLRSEFRFAATPVVIISKPGERQMVRDLVRADHRLGSIVPGLPPEQIKTAVDDVARAVGITAITSGVGTSLALETAETLRMLAATANPLFAVRDAEPALLAALGSTERPLRMLAARVLVYLPDAAAQEAIAKIALSATEAEDFRVEMFAVLSDAARQCGNHLGAASVTEIAAIAEKDPNLVIRTAASQALGALNLPGNKGSEIVRNQYGG